MFSLSPFLCGDTLSLMERMDNDCYHAVVTDPPYASGGLTTAERKASPARKYLSSSRYLSFDNDTRDQRTHFMWSVMWRQEALRITRHGSVFRHYLKPSGKICSFQERGQAWKCIFFTLFFHNRGQVKNNNKLAFQTFSGTLPA